MAEKETETKTIYGAVILRNMDSVKTRNKKNKSTSALERHPHEKRLQLCSSRVLNEKEKTLYQKIFIKTSLRTVSGCYLLCHRISNCTSALQLYIYALHLHSPKCDLIVVASKTC